MSITIMENFYENIFAGIPEGLLIISEEKNIVRVNPAAEDILGHSFAQLLKKKIEEVFPGRPHLIKKIASSLENGDVFIDLEEEYIRSFPLQKISLGVNISPLRNNNGKIKGVILLFRDLSNLKNFHEEEKTSMSLSGITTLALCLAHEIKNPLSGIKGVSQLLLNSKENQDDSEEYLRLIIREVERINQLVEGLLDLSKPKKLDIQRLNINRIIENLILMEKETEKGKEIRFCKYYDPSLPPVSADEAEMKKLFFNLLRNAVEACPSAGLVTISTRFFTDYQLTDKKGNLSRVVLIEIKNNGKGIPEENLKDVFTPFFSTKKKGTGLGLTIVHKIVEDHRGRIKLISGHDHPETVVQVFLPISA